MKLENYEVHLPSYSIGDKIYDKIGLVCESYGKTVLVIGGKRALEAAYDKIKAAVDQTNLTIIGKELYGKDCTYQTVEKLRALPVYQEADMVFGVGSGFMTPLISVLIILGAVSTAVNMVAAMVKRICNGIEKIENKDKKEEKNQQAAEGKPVVRTVIAALICCLVDFGIAQFGLLTLIQKAYSALAYLAIPVILIPYIIHMIVTRFDTK